VNRGAVAGRASRPAGPWAIGVTALLVSLPGAANRSAPIPHTLGRNTTVHATGTFTPVGPPLGTPRRVDAGGNCVIDLRQRYAVSGTLEGSFLIDYRILTYGACPEGPPRPGTYEETWIAHGTFTGTFEEGNTSADFTYTADVHRGGDVDGAMELGGDLRGKLTVTGRMSERRLSYDGDVEAS